MRNARIVWSLAALIIVLLGIGIGGYAQLGSSSSHLSNPSAIRAVSPTIPVVPPQPLSHAASAHPAAPAATTHADPPARPAGQPARPAAHAASQPASRARSLATPAPQPTADFVYVVQPGDTLWSLAAAHLGNPHRWGQLYNLNRDRAEPGGQHLVNPDRIYVGWTLEFPPGVAGWSV